MVRRDHVVKERLVIILFHGLVSIAFGTTRPRCERQVIILYHGLVSIAYGTIRLCCERKTGYYFISRSGFNRIWYDETTL